MVSSFLDGKVSFIENLFLLYRKKLDLPSLVQIVYKLLAILYKTSYNNLCGKDENIGVLPCDVRSAGKEPQEIKNLV